MNRRNTTYSRYSSHSSRAAHARGARQFRKYDTSLIKPKMSKTPYIVGGIIIAVLVLALIFGISSCVNGGHNDKLLSSDQTVRVEIASGSTTNEIADILYDKGLIDNKTDFTNTVKAKNVGNSLKPGIYTFAGGLSYSEIIDKLVAGPSTADSSLVVSEGTTISALASVVENAYAGTITASDFIAEAHNASAYASEFPFVADAYNNSLEGFLFPKTYEVMVGATAKDVIKQMLTQYQNETASLDYSYAQSKGLSKYQVLILASIIEKEGTTDTFSRVSAVFYNRLTTNGAPAYGLLGSDATTAYELGGDVDGYDWTTDSPYNTRVHKGLCPSPICSPSLAALQAACSPQSGFEDYYFFSFWPNGDGTVNYYFDKTYEEHQATISAHS